MVSRLPSLLLSLLLVLQATSASALLPRRVPPPRGPGFGSRGGATGGHGVGTIT